MDETIAVGKEAMRLFLTYDTNGDGVMDKDEFSIFYTDMLKEFGIPPPSEEDIETAIKVLDKDKNNEVSFEVFISFLFVNYYYYYLLVITIIII